jgi:hypothetical protein
MIYIELVGSLVYFFTREMWDNIEKENKLIADIAITKIRDGANFHFIVFI